MRKDLIVHPTTPANGASAVRVSLARPRPNALTLTYEVTGTANLILPEPAVPARTDDLWKHTCFEAFLCAGDASAYIEFNLSPSTRWAAYSFTRYREGMANLDLPHPPRIETTTAQNGYTLTAEVPVPLPAPPWYVGLTAVIEEQGGRLSYWALAHPSPKPDFHNANGFVLKLD